MQNREPVTGIVLCSSTARSGMSTKMMAHTPAAATAGTEKVTISPSASMVIGDML